MSPVEACPDHHTVKQLTMTLKALLASTESTFGARISELTRSRPRDGTDFFRFRRCIVQSTLGMAPLNLCFNILFYVFLLSLFTRITSALFIYDRRTLLDIGHHCTNLLQDTLSTDPAWPLEILRTAEVNKGRLNNPRRRRKHRGRRAGIRNRLRKRAHSPPLPSILLANVQSLENKMDDLRARISFQRDIRDCNILCLTETWLTPSVPDTA